MSDTGPMVLCFFQGRGRAVSSPNSPVNDPRRVTSSPHDLNQAEPCECIAPQGDREALAQAEKAATIPRTQAESEQDAQIFQPRGILKQTSSVSVYDNVGAMGRGQDSSQMRQSIHVEDPSKHGSQNIYTGPRSVSTGPFSYHTDPNISAGTPGMFTSFGKDLSRPRVTSAKTCENVRLETAFIGNVDNIASGRKSVTLANLPTDKEKISVTEKSAVTSTEEANLDANVVVRKDCVRILAPQPQKLLPPDSPHGAGSDHSNSPEWPSPPEPLTPLTPIIPMCNMDFDSESIKKMLQALVTSPDSVSMTGSIHEHDQGFHDDPSYVGHMTGELKPGSSTQNEDANIEHAKYSETDNGAQKPIDIESKPLECELPGIKCVRNSYGRDSNPDSGIGGMVGDLAAVSSSSGDSTDNKPVTGKASWRVCL